MLITENEQTQKPVDNVIPIAERQPEIDPEILTVLLLRQQVQELLDGHTSQNAAARQIGVSPATLSLWLNGKYGTIRGKEEGVTAKVARWMVSSRYAQGAKAYVATPTCQRIETALTHAQKYGDMVAVTGGPGIGKSTVARRYLEENTNAWLVTISPATSGLIPALEAVARAVRVKETVSGAARLSEAIEKKIGEWRGVIIVDESQHLSMAAVEQLRSIHDVTGTGLALMGNENSYTRFLGGPREAHYAQIRSRIGMKTLLGRPTPEDVATMLAAWGCTDQECMPSLLEVARRPGAMRNVVKVLRWCAESHGTITPDAVIAAGGLIGVGG